MFTTYKDEENKFQLVEEPDPLLSYTYAELSINVNDIFTK
jgi:hypothetical protein